MINTESARDELLFYHSEMNIIVSYNIKHCMFFYSKHKSSEYLGPPINILKNLLCNDYEFIGFV